MMSPLHVNFEQLLPHRPPMLMLTAMLTRESDHVHCTSVIEEHNPLLRDGLFPASGALELLAQAAGILLGTRLPDKAARPGAIVQVKSFQLEPLRIPVGTELHIHARYQAGTVEAAMFDGEVTIKDQPLFAGSLMIALLPGETV
jgi:predicted hotdog family 3-hydroxylacyl-ACP dehydratase